MSKKGLSKAAKDKTWTILAYLVAAPPPFTKQEPGDVDFMTKKVIATRDALVNGLPSSACAAIRTCWDGLNGPNGSRFSAEIVRGTGQLRPSDHFNIMVPKVLPTTTSAAIDLNGFYEWALPQLKPTKHYAVHFWGHSFGPGGLFEKGGAIAIPKQVPPGTPFSGGREGGPEPLSISSH